MKTIIYNGDSPIVPGAIGRFAMNPKVLREFDNYPIVTDENYKWFLVTDDLGRDIIAFASLKVFKSKVKFINSYVTEPYRRKGIHTKLINERLKWCTENDVKHIEVDCLSSSLQQYLKLGFKEVKTFVKWHKLEKRL